MLKLAANWDFSQKLSTAVQSRLPNVRHPTSQWKMRLFNGPGMFLVMRILCVSLCIYF